MAHRLWTIWNSNKFWISIKFYPASLPFFFKSKIMNNKSKKELYTSKRAIKSPLCNCHHPAARPKQKSNNNRKCNNVNLYRHYKRRKRWREKPFKWKEHYFHRIPMENEHKIWVSAKYLWNICFCYYSHRTQFSAKKLFLYFFGMVKFFFFAFPSSQYSHFRFLFNFYFYYFLFVYFQQQYSLAMRYMCVAIQQMCTILRCFYSSASIKKLNK